MKKIAIALVVIMLLCLCACSDNELTNNIGDNNSNDTNTNTNTSSVISDFELPERDDPTDSSNTSSTNKDYNTSHDPDDDQSDLTVTKNLTLEVEKTLHSSSVIMINIVLRNEKGKFNYYNDFFLQKYVNGKWEYHTTLTDSIDYKYYIATSQGNLEFITYDLRKNYSTPLPTGTYRFIQESDSGKLVSNSFEIVDNIITDENQPTQ